MQNSCWFTSSRSQNCHIIFIYYFLLLSLGCFFVLIGSYYLPSQRKHKVLGPVVQSPISADPGLTLGFVKS